MLIGILIGIGGAAGGGDTTPPVGPTSGILSENGDFLTTEGGDYLIKE